MVLALTAKAALLSGDPCRFWGVIFGVSCDRKTWSDGDGVAGQVSAGIGRDELLLLTQYSVKEDTEMNEPPCLQRPRGACALMLLPRTTRANDDNAKSHTIPRCTPCESAPTRHIPNLVDEWERSEEPAI